MLLLKANKNLRYQFFVFYFKTDIFFLLFTKTKGIKKSKLPKVSLILKAI